MSKKLLALLITVLMVCLTGCGNVETQLTDGKDILISIGKTTITKQDFYEDIPSAYIANAVAEMVQKSIVASEIERTDETVAEAKEQLETYRKDIEEEGDDFMEVITSYGYESEEDFLNDIIFNLEYYKLMETYINDNFDDYWGRYYPCKAKIMFFDGKESLETAGIKSQDAFDEINSGANFEEVADKYEADKTLIKETFYTKDNKSLDKNIISMIVASNGERTFRTEAGDRDGYYIVQITNMKQSQLTEDLVAYLKSLSLVGDEMLAFYSSKHNFQVYDVNIRDYLQNDYPAILSEQ